MDITTYIHAYLQRDEEIMCEKAHTNRDSKSMCTSSKHANGPQRV